MSSSNSNILAKGEDYFLSRVTTLDRVEATSYPWVYSYFYHKFLDVTAIKYLRDTYRKDGSFFMLLLWSLAVIFLVIFLLLPEQLFILSSSVLQTFVGFITPCLVCFFVYLWTGLILKYHQLRFTVRTCFISCVVLEVLIEVFVNTGFTSAVKSLVTGVTLSFIVLSSGLCIMEKKYLTVSGVVSSIILLRFIIIENLSFVSYRHALPPLLAYTCVISGLAISTLPTIQIPYFNEEDFVESLASPFDMSTIPIIRQRRASSVEVPSTVNHNGAANLAKTRRKSLPVLGLPQRKVSMSSMDLTILGEAHGMITDLLADSSLPMNVTGTLRIVADMISPLLQHSFQRNQSLPTHQLLTVFEKHIQEDEEQVMNQPDLKDDTPLSLKQRLQRNLGVSSRRMSSSYTTTTSATGMPTIDMEYHGKKSTGSNNVKAPNKRNTQNRSKSYAGVLSASERSKAFANKSHSFTQSSSSPSHSPRTSECKISEEDIFKVEITRGKPVFFDGMDPDTDGDDDDIYSEDDNKRTKDNSVTDDISIKHSDNLDNRKLVKKLSSLSEHLEDDSDDIFDTISNTDTASCKPDITIDNVNNVTNKDDRSNNIVTNNEPSVFSEESVNNKQSDNTREVVPPLTQRTLNLNIAEVAPVQKSSSEESVMSPRESLSIPVNQNRRRSSRELHLEYEMAVSRDVDGLLVNLNEWDFPIFELSEKCNVLTQLAFRIFQVCGFFNTFKIPETTFLKYFRALESGYHNIPYHNRIHAADVLHGVYYLTQHKIPGFNTLSSRRSSIHEDASPTLEEEDELTYGCISDCVPELELMALYTAASMHDFDHPGRTNAFLVATLNPKALLYNDRSVLENHHAAASWSLLVTNPSLNFLSGLDPVDFKRFRFIVIEEILSTDLKKHFDFLTEWNAKVSGDQGSGLNFTNEADRLLVGQMAIKLADISGPSKEWNLHYRWTDRIIEEFYQQGEDEKTLGMSMSAYMDRDDPKVPQLQASFIKHLVSPLYMSYEKAGIMPGDWVVSHDDDEERNSDASVSDGDSCENEKDGGMKTKKSVYSIVIDNIQKNHVKWLKIIEENEIKSQENIDITDNDDDASPVKNNAPTEED